MLRIHPFPALRPRPELAARVSCVPYDVVDRDEAAALVRGNPDSFLHVCRPDIDLPAAAAGEPAALHRQAAAAFRALLGRGVWERDPAPTVYLYRLCRGSREQLGLVAGFHVGDYERNLIRRHEKTRADKEEDRTRHAAAIGAHGGLVLLTCRDDPVFARQMAATAAGPPLLDFEDAQAVRHTVWRAADPEPLAATCRNLPVVYIADGHHRAAAAARVAQEMRGAGAAGEQESDWFPAALFPAGQMTILPYHRCVRELAGRTPAAFLADLRHRGLLGGPAQPEPAGPGLASLYCAGAWHVLRLPPPAAADAVSALDVSRLQAGVLAPLLGISDPRADQRLDFVGGSRGAGELARRVNASQAAAAFAMFPLDVHQLMQVADAGACLPPKSTWFEPKVRSGLLVHTFRPPACQITPI